MRFAPFVVAVHPSEGNLMLDDATMSRMTGHQHIDEACESTRKLTYADFVRLPDDGRRHEFIDGVHYVTAPSFWHGIVQQKLNFALAKHLDATRAGFVLSNMDCVLSLFDIVQPDIIVVLADRYDIVTNRNIKGAPSIAVEVLSPSTSTRDRTLKRDLYERKGVAEYWIVDERLNTIEIYRRRKQKFMKPLRLREAEQDVLVSGLLPGFELPLSELFNEELN